MRLLRALAASLALLAASPVHADRDFQRRSAELIQAHKNSAGRLEAPIAATVRAVLAGKHVYVARDSWGSEATGRAGGMTGLLAYDPVAAQSGDVVWMDYDQHSFAEALKAAVQAESRGCEAILFGPRPGNGEPYRLWVDSFNSGNDDGPLTLFGNLLSLWEAQGELIAAASRSGKRLAVNVTYLLPESKQNYEAGTLFDTQRPQLDPIPPNVMAGEYLDAVQKMFRDIDQKQSAPLHAAAELISADLRAHKKVIYTSVGHLMQTDGAHSSRRFLYVGSSASAAEYLREMGEGGGVVLYLGYVPAQQPFDAAAGLRKRGIPMIWSGVPPDNLDAWIAPGEVFIDQQWLLGDCAVRDHGSPCMLALSGVSELYLLERLRDMTGDSRQ
jgi:hypothetical protein